MPPLEMDFQFPPQPNFLLAFRACGYVLPPEALLMLVQESIDVS
jgi:hypothetical protein